MRLVSIGHDRARFEDVTLKFLDRAGKPTNSVVWLRNGGGKTSLLSLFFAGIKPHQRDFLGKRAEEGVRGIDDYVGSQDQGVVVCEWELDTDRTIPEGGGPRYLTGVFYQRGSAQEGGEVSKVDRLFFAAMSSSSVSELTLEGLPLSVDDPSRRMRRNLNGFRRRLRQLDSEHPDLQIFVSEVQNKFEEELSSRGLDPVVFHYQVLMNEREGGVAERFSFAQDEDFLDFLIEMAFDENRAREVREQLTTFRYELVERNEQLKPELEFCRGMVIRLQKMVGVEGDRSVVFQDIEVARSLLVRLFGWVSERLAVLISQQQGLESSIRDSQSSADAARRDADLSNRMAAVYRRQAARLRFNSIKQEYGAASAAHAGAKRLKNIWYAARPLARVWEARRRAVQLRDQLAKKLQEFAPELAELNEIATRFANALEFDATALRSSEAQQRNTEAKLRQDAGSALESAAAFGEKAATAEAEAKRLRELLGRANSEMDHLRRNRVLLEGELTVENAAGRISEEISSYNAQIGDQEARIVSQTSIRTETIARRTAVECVLGNLNVERADLEASWNRANDRRVELETDAALLRLLQTDRVDVQNATARAVEAATEELRRTTETILRIRVEAAENIRAIHWLEGDAALLPPSKDVEGLIHWLRSQKIVCWSGWEYIERNGGPTPTDRREIVQRLPYLATGVVVADNQHDATVAMLSRHSQFEHVRLMGPVVVMPAVAFSAQGELTWTVLGPSSDGHFDKHAAALELNRLRTGESERQIEVQGFETWQKELSSLQHRLRAFQAEFPAGWFAGHRQKIDVCVAKIEEAEQSRERNVQQVEALDRDIEDARVAIKTMLTERGQLQRSEDQLKTFLRQFGSHIPKWTRELADAERDATRFRTNQKRQKELAEQFGGEASKSARMAEDSGSRAQRLEGEFDAVKYTDPGKRKSTEGVVDTLRADYTTVLDDYEQKVNADALSQMAVAKDREADREQQEFERVLSSLDDIEAADVERELAGLSETMSAERRFEQSDREEREAFQRLGTLANKRTPVETEFNEASSECTTLENVASLPTLQMAESVPENEAAFQHYKDDAEERLRLAEEFDIEIGICGERLTKVTHEVAILEKDKAALQTVSAANQELFERLDISLESRGKTFVASEPAILVRDADDLARQATALGGRLQKSRELQQDLDRRRDQIGEDASAWARQPRFTKFATSISQRFANRRPSELESKASFFITQLDDAIFQIEEKLKEANRHHDRVIDILLSAVDEALSLVKRVSSMSRLPESLPQAGKHFVVVETKESDNPSERRTRVADLVDEILQTGEIGDGLSLIQKAVRRVAGRAKFSVLHPDLYHDANRMSISAVRALSAGERLTSAILFYCALVRLRHTEGNRKGSSVLILDNPIGTASRVSFLDLQREVAQSMNIQLIYATGVKDLSAVGALENIIRLRNTRADARTGRRLVELEAEDKKIRRIEAARITFDSAPSSAVADMPKASEAVAGLPDDATRH